METDLAHFVIFLKTTWGTLSGITVFFPFFGVLTGILPTPKGKKTQFIGITSIVSVFTIYFIFIVVRSPNVLLVGVISAVLFFMGLLTFITLVSEGLDPNNKPGNDPADYGYQMILYIITFGCFTAAFTLIAVIDFWRR